MNIGKAMRMIREENGLSRPQMAEKLGMTLGALWKIENNRTRPKESTIAKACFLCKVPFARFYTLAFERNDFDLISVVASVPDELILNELRQ